MYLRSFTVTMLALAVASCAEAPLAPATQADLGLLWVKHAAEYRALAQQVYKQAELALPRYLEDTSWSALPGQRGAAELPPAIIFDVDDTVVSGVDFQFALEPPFENKKHEEWNARNAAVAIPGFVRFAERALAAGVELFFITNRPCEAVAGEPCPQEATAVLDILEAGIETDAEHVLLAFEQEDWGKEKVTRRDYVARTHRVVMLFGDDIGDFIPCTRARPAGPCGTGASRASRDELLAAFSDYFGAGWYILPNPMYGSWTTVQ